MKTYRKLCLVFVSLGLFLPVAVTDVFAENNTSSAKKVVVSGDAKIARDSKSEIGKVQKKMKSQRRASQPTQSDVTDVSVNNELQKALDLSLSISGLDTSATNEPAISSNQPGALNFFATEKKPQRSLFLDGQVLMSQEPEADKKKSMDGAGISINLKR